MPERPPPYVFVTPQRLKRIKERRRIGKWNSRSELINNMTKKYTEIRCKANIVKCTINDLRRSAITNWAHLLPIQVVQTLAGHADIITLWMIDTILTPMGIFGPQHKRLANIIACQPITYKTRPMRLELTTFGSTVRCSNQLSYDPVNSINCVI